MRVRKREEGLTGESRSADQAQHKWWRGWVPEVRKWFCVAAVEASSCQAGRPTEQDSGLPLAVGTIGGVLL